MDMLRVWNEVGDGCQCSDEHIVRRQQNNRAEFARIYARGVSHCGFPLREQPKKQRHVEP